MASPREYDHRSDAVSSMSTRWSNGRYSPPVLTVPSPPPPRIRRHHFHETAPWPQQRYHDYAFIEGWGWWPRWFPYWDAQWRAYWWQLYDYYGGDNYAEYAEYARDAMLRSHAPLWGLVVSGSPGTAQIGMQPYGVSPVAERSRYQNRPDQVLAYRGVALDSARRIAAATGGLFFGYRDSPWGSELSVFGTRAGLQRWANEQSVDTDVWYAVTFDLSSSATPLSEVAR